MNESSGERGEEEILGRLPRTRPGRRSPRRDEAAERRARSAARSSAAADTASRDAAEREQRRGDERLEQPAEQPGVGDALAGVARTGVSVASGTVGLGLRAAGGALRAIRDTVDRR